MQEELAADRNPVAVMCQLLELARQSYYRWLVRADRALASVLLRQARSPRETTHGGRVRANAQKEATRSITCSSSCTPNTFTEHPKASCDIESFRCEIYFTELLASVY